MPTVPNPFHQARARRLSSDQSGGLLPAFQKLVLYGGSIFILMNFFVLLGLTNTDPKSTTGSAPVSVGAVARNTKAIAGSVTINKGSIQCPFRQYPPRRYYGLQKMEQPDFLVGVDYVYNKLPIMLLPDTNTDLLNYKEQGKLCADQSGWLTPEKNDPTKELPFADGTNPSILSLTRLEKSYPQLVQQWRKLGGKFVATLCMTDSQCAYKDTPEEIQNFKISQEKKAAVVHTLLLILDDQFQSLLQTTIYTERDAPWGRRFKKAAPNGSGGFEKMTRALDDARLFIHLDKLWVSYRDGPSFGYEQQVLNEIHMTFDESLPKAEQMTATLKASQSASFCCGRNMALMEHLEDPTQLQALTWADPVTVVDVDDQRQNGMDQQKRRRLEEADHRRLAEGGAKKSHFHGTNAFMVYLPATDEFLGIGHFHRPSGRDAFNPYARFGHHYTHTWFTISSRPPFHLKRLSQEFVLPSKSKILQDDDAEIIQFLSGLEVITLEGNKEYAVIAYGINDCEGAVVYMGMDKVHEMLLPVEQGKEVVDLMGPVP